MSLTNTKWLVGSTAQTLTASYAATTAATYAHVGGMIQGILLVAYTPKTGQSNRNASIYLEVSYDDATSWYPISKGEDAAGSAGELVTTVFINSWKLPGATGGTVYRFRIPFALGDGGRDERGYFKSAIIRAKIKEDGSADFGTLSAFCTTYGEVD